MIIFLFRHAETDDRMFEEFEIFVWLRPMIVS